MPITQAKVPCAQVTDHARVYGCTLDPHAAWLVQRGMKTLVLRVSIVSVIFKSVPAFMYLSLFVRINQLICSV